MNDTTRFDCNYYYSPIGIIKIVANNEAIFAISFVDEIKEGATDNQLISRAIAQIDEYFSGIRKTFDLPLFSNRGTLFQQAVWNALLTINYASKTTYRQLAQDINRPNAQQGVGQACSRNPWAIIVPCHRVVAASGSLHGYAYGLDRKAFLLNHEQAYLSNK